MPKIDTQTMLITDIEKDEKILEVCRAKFNAQFLDRLGSTVFEAVLTGLVAVVAGTLVFGFSPVVGMIIWAVSMCLLLWLEYTRIMGIINTFTRWRASPELPFVQGNMGLIGRTTVRSVLGAFTLNVLIVLLLALAFFNVMSSIGYAVLTIASGLFIAFLYVAIAFMLWRRVEAELAKHDFSRPTPKAD